MEDKSEAQTALKECRQQYGLYRHYKGGYYVMYGKTVDEETLETLVHYYSLEKKTRWTRTLENFTAKVYLEDRKDQQRFEYVREASLNELLEAYDNTELINYLRGMALGQRMLAEIKL